MAISLQIMLHVKHFCHDVEFILYALDKYRRVFVDSLLQRVYYRY